MKAASNQRRRVHRRRALRLRDRIRYVVRPGGEVLLSRADGDDETDPALDAFLGFLAQDIAAHPERVRAIDSGLVQRIRALTDSVEIDLDAPLSPDDESALQRRLRRGRVPPPGSGAYQPSCSGISSDQSSTGLDRE
ncbi:MAG: type II toxin-antitoxin system PrlF family antitoxin [Burkholderiaceae bacterium]|jgi:antitoxin PrlF|nr:type II toxin-antitoxin system PrlF family antitoxin [Burkholderiaceae bacterium]